MMTNLQLIAHFMKLNPDLSKEQVLTVQNMLEYVEIRTRQEIVEETLQERFAMFRKPEPQGT